MRVVFSDLARARLHAIQSYIALLGMIGEHLGGIDDPVHDRCGPSIAARARALVVSGLPYRIHYRIDEAAEMVEIITVAHTRQKPPRFE